MNTMIILRPLEQTSSITTIKKPTNDDNEYQIDYNQGSTSRTKNSTCISHVDSQFQTKNIDIKLHIASYLDIRPDIIQLYSKDSNSQFTELKDKESFAMVVMNSKDTFLSSPSNFQMVKSPKRNKSKVVIYFSITIEQQSVMINLFNHNIDKILFDLSPYCSIYLLKHLICQKIKSPIFRDSQILYSTGLISSKEENISSYPAKTMYLNRPATSHKLSDDKIIKDIIEYYAHNSNHDEANDIILNLIFAEKTKEKYKIGLDFSFNLMKTSNKIDFKDNAPSYCEVSDGLNLFVYCYNNKCSIYKEMFTTKIGYGQFDIIEFCKIAKCPKCSDRKYVEVKNIGMIKSQWKYKGLLAGKDCSKCEGDGFTIDDKLYVLTERNLMKQFTSMLIEIKPYLNVIDLDVRKEDNLQSINSDDESVDLIDIGLCSPIVNKKKRHSSINASLFPSRIPITQAEMTNNKENIIIEKNNEKQQCTGCSGIIIDTNVCVIF